MKENNRRGKSTDAPPEPVDRERNSNRSGGEVQLRNVLLFLPRLIKLLGRLIADPDVSRGDKALLVGTLAYAITPIDLIPDFIPGLGELDDLYLIALILLRLINRAGQEKVRSYWDGPEDIVAMLETCTRVATAILPARLRRLIEVAAGKDDPGGWLRRKGRSKEGGPPSSTDPSAER